MRHIKYKKSVTEIKYIQVKRKIFRVSSGKCNYLYLSYSNTMLTKILLKAHVAYKSTPKNIH